MTTICIDPNNFLSDTFRLTPIKYRTYAKRQETPPFFRYNGADYNLVGISPDSEEISAFRNKMDELEPSDALFDLDVGTGKIRITAGVHGIYGHPGAGKTTFAQYLASKIAEETGKKVGFLRIGEREYGALSLTNVESLRWMMSGILEYEVTVVDSIRQLIYFGDGAAGPTGIYLSVFGALTSLFDVCRLKKSALFVVATPLYDESSDESRTVYQTKLIQAGLNSVCQSIITIDSTHRLSFTQRDNVEIQVHDSDDISIITTPQKRKEMRQSFAPVYNDREADPFIGV